MVEVMYEHVRQSSSINSLISCITFLKIQNVSHDDDMSRMHQSLKDADFCRINAKFWRQPRQEKALVQLTALSLGQ
jgi:hypothetical protein